MEIVRNTGECKTAVRRSHLDTGNGCHLDCRHCPAPGIIRNPNNTVFLEDGVLQYKSISPDTGRPIKVQSGTRTNYNAFRRYHIYEDADGNHKSTYGDDPIFTEARTVIRNFNQDEAGS